MSPVGNRAKLSSWAGTLRGLGLRSLSLQALHKARLKSGWYERSLPAGEWRELDDSVLRSARPVFRSTTREDLKAWRTKNPGIVPKGQVHSDLAAAALAAGERIARGELLYFSSCWLPRPADWRTNPRTGHPTPLEHWATLPPFAGPEQGDVKWIWEASRFDWVYQLGRAWAFSTSKEQAEVFATAFWSLLDDWMEHNPPNQGINWRCGQEAAFRLIALVWAAGTIAKTPSATEQRVARLWMCVEALAQRVDRAMAHGLSQNNNHSLSESAALFLAGTALPTHPLAAQWYGKGMRHFVRECERQFKPDGGYVQHSFNYARVALRDAFVFLTALDHYEDPLPRVVRERLIAATEFLYQVQDDASGQVPNYGANDGANVLSLSGCAYEDFRPLLQLLSWKLDGRRLYESGPWDEELAWHFDGDALQGEAEPRRRRSFGREQSGYFGIRTERSFGLLRCHSFGTRPGDADMLALDLWMDGCNVLPDRGSYSYNDPEGIGQQLRGTACHNTVTIDDLDQMTPGSRFLWLNWTRSELGGFGARRLDGWPGWHFDGNHRGYQRDNLDVVHRRQVLQLDDEWIIIDDLAVRDEQTHDFTLHWLVARDAPEDFQIDVYGPGEDHWARASDLDQDTIPPSASVSRTYGELTAHNKLTRTATQPESLRWVTHIHCSSGDSDSILLPDGTLTWKGRSISPKFSGAL